MNILLATILSRDAKEFCKLSVFHFTRNLVDSFCAEMKSVLVLLSILFIALAESTASLSKPPVPYDNVGCWKDGKPKSEQECNKEIVLQFYQKLFFDQDPNAIDDYVGSYIQHNPFAADGKAGLREIIPQLLKTATTKIVDIKRVAADGDLVWAHMKMNVFGRESAVVDIFRIKDGKIEEHWDVIQAIPEKSRNSNTMF